MEYCVNSGFITTFGINVAMTTIGLFTFLTLFYIYYASDVAQTVVTKRLNSIIHDTLLGKLNQLDNNQQQILKRLLANIPLQNMINLANTDTTAGINNEWLFGTAKVVIIGLWIFLVLIVALLIYNCKKCIPISSITISNLIVFILIGAVEAIFFIKIAAHYIPTKPSFIASELIDSLKNNIDSRA